MFTGRKKEGLRALAAGIDIWIHELTSLADSGPIFRAHLDFQSFEQPGCASTRMR
jgi:hypothetical protein